MQNQPGGARRAAGARDGKDFAQDVDPSRRGITHAHHLQIADIPLEAGRQTAPGKAKIQDGSNALAAMTTVLVPFFAAQADTQVLQRGGPFRNHTDFFEAVEACTIVDDLK